MRQIGRIIISFTLFALLFGCKSAHEVASIPQVENPIAAFERDVKWQLMTIRQHDVEYGEYQKHIYIQFNPDAGTISGFAGCNRFWGNFSVGKDCAITFSNLGINDKKCPDSEMDLEQKFFPLLSKVNRYDISNYTITLYQGDRELLEFENPED